MELEQGMLDELLLVCTFVGTKKVTDDDETPVESFVKGEDCVSWLQDLQRALRRDDGDARAVRTTVGAWDVLRTRLLPLAELSSSDLVATRTLCKIFVLLTMPLSDKCHQALAARPDPVKDKTRAADALKKRQALRESASRQARQLIEARLAFAERPKVLRGLLRMFEGARKPRERRTSSDDADVELALTLLRNLVAPLPHTTDSDARDAGASLDALVAALDAELVLDTVADLCSASSKRENRHWGLVLVEVLAPLLAQHKPADIAQTEVLATKKSERATQKKAVDDRLERALLSRDEDAVEADAQLRKALDDASKRPVGGGALSRARDREKAARTLAFASRHHRFGTCLRVTPVGSDDSKLVAGTAALRNRAAIQGDGDTTLHSVSCAQRRRPIFVAPHKVGAVRKAGRKKASKEEEEDKPHRDELSDDEQDQDWGQGRQQDEVLRVTTTTRRGVGADDARLAVSTFVARLARHGAGRLLDRVKHELRTDSSAVQKKDAHYFFALAEWLLAWRRERAAVLSRRLSRAARDGSGDPAEFTEATFFPRSLLKLVDVFTVKSCLDDISHARDRKRRLEVERSVSLYREILRALEALQHGDRESRKDRSRLAGSEIAPDATCSAVASGMLDKVFFAPEAADPLHSLLREWKAGQHTKRYACDLVEILHSTCKVMDASKHGNPAEYLRKVLKPTQTLDIYGALLEAFASNAPAVNHFVYAFLRKVAYCPLEGMQGKPSGNAITTLEPLLYRARYFVAFAQVLEDKSRDATIERLQDLAASTLRHFDAHAQRTPLLYVEALFGHAGAPVDQWCRGLSYDNGVEAYGGSAKMRVDAGPAWQGSDEEASVDDDAFARLDEEDARAKERLKQAKLNAPAVDRRRWQPAEDAALCLVYAKVVEVDGDLDAEKVARMSVLLPHHRDPKKLRARVNKLTDEAVKAFPVPEELDETEGWVRALRSYAEQLRTKKVSSKSSSKKKKHASDDESEEDNEEPIVYDDREMEVDTSLGRTRIQTQSERPPSPEPDAEAVDDKWSDRRTYVRKAPPAAPVNRLKRASDAAAASDDEEFAFDDAPAAAPASPGVNAAPTPKTAPKRRRVVVDDEDEDE